MTHPEDRVPPKEISLALSRQPYALRVHPSYIRAIRRTTAGTGLFILGCARPREVFDWLAAHPDFRRRHTERMSSIGLM
jgi:hypothetical protein